MLEKLRLPGLIFAVAALAAGLVGAHVARLIEDLGRHRAESALNAGGMVWAGVLADGLILELTGEAPDEEEREAAFALLSRAAQAPALLQATARDGATARLAQTRHRAEARVEIMRGLNDLAVVGAAPGAAARAALADALGDAAPELALADLSSADAADGAADWEKAVEPAAEIAAALLHGGVVITPGRLSLSGVAGGAVDLARIDAAMAKAEAAGLIVESDLASSPVPTAAFVVRAEKGPQTGGLSACAARDMAEAARLIAAAAALGAAPAPPCAIGPGAPDGWSEAALAALRALAALPAGEVSIVGQRARFTALPPTRRRAFERAAETLRTELPPDFKLSLLSGEVAEAPPMAETGEAANDVSGTPALPLAVTHDGLTLRISGAAPDPLIGESVAAYARVTMPGGEVETALSYDGVFAPGWRPAAMAMISALSKLERGRARLGPESVEVEGEIRDPLAIADLQRELVQSLDDGRRAETRITVSPARLAAAQPLPPIRCAAALTEVVSTDPIRFSPGSAEIDEASAPVVARLTETLARCAGGRIEIAGHTDSQGSEKTNLRLSRARAEAVLGALLKAGARLSLLTSAGYGEAEPIADNGTEAGRALNRRIEFRVLEDGETP
ncbi:OmpA family protein [Pikeienuella piscinae]|uniref:OmpA family protein n=1 Tax=Pikeienuella piscinae TaxID=2748098 RepID=A0A7L5BVT8_9RHOB|nr:OmpA family protein [Pikeienuella piscinae]QIE55882.1 OmpA family protein [Pikeienuella piscinae]